MKLDNLPTGRNSHGFTIVELLIVIVVIGILAAIAIVAYSGIQQRTYNAKRMADLDGISKGLELYYADNGRYPVSAYSGDAYSCLSAPHWSCWNGTAPNRLLSSSYYAGSLPQDPQYVDSEACGYPNTHVTRAYHYQVNIDGSGYLLGAYLPGLSTSNARYIAPASRGCASYINYAVKGGVSF